MRPRRDDYTGKLLDDQGEGTWEDHGFHIEDPYYLIGEDEDDQPPGWD